MITPLHEALEALRTGAISIEEYQRQRQIGWRLISMAEYDEMLVTSAASGAPSLCHEDSRRWGSQHCVGELDPWRRLTDEQRGELVVRSACSGIWSECSPATVTINGKTVVAPPGWRPRRHTSTAPMGETESNEGTPT